MENAQEINNWSAYFLNTTFVSTQNRPDCIYSSVHVMGCMWALRKIEQDERQEAGLRG
jgi:hypothetical protein